MTTQKQIKDFGHAKRFNYDIDAIFADIRKREAKRNNLSNLQPVKPSLPYVAEGRATRRIRPSGFAKQAERALQLAVADAIEEHRRAGKPVVVARMGRPVLIRAEEVRTVREKRAVYRSRKPRKK